MGNAEISGSDKAPGAFRTIGELSADLGVPQHILRYWETKFSQLKPLQRAGNRRYYRAEDVTLARRIHRLLSNEGYTVRGVQQLLAVKAEATPQSDAMPTPAPSMAPPSIDLARLKTLRDRLAEALSA
ncbi:MAG: MerR family transcriptional regulator [Sphingomicrobium sp.]